MSRLLTDDLTEHREEIYLLLRGMSNLGKPFLLRSEILEQLELHVEQHPESTLGTSPLGTLVRQCQEAAIQAPWIYLARRSRIGHWTHYRFHMEAFDLEQVSVSDYLAFKERLVDGPAGEGGWPLEIDLEPFNRGFPRLQESRSIGQGVSFLNRKLSSELFQDAGEQKLFEFLRLHEFHGKQLMLGDRLTRVDQLVRALRQADTLLAGVSGETPWDELESKLGPMGFERGWGKNASRVRDTMHLLSEIVEAPDPKILERFLARIPMIFSIVILTPHGYFGQSNVLGLPDTGGQVVYILDQARALEKEMYKRLDEAGIDFDPRILVVTRLIPEAGETTCDQRTERVVGTRNATILRVPFRDEGGEIVPHWISRFEVWPYLERYALEVEKEVLAELGDRPGILVGNYSDGNIVASLMARRLHVTQCNIAHALEKTKYLMSDLFWRENDEKYHFSCQFTADLIAMNTADFIITSTYQEIAGTEESIGQYESYSAFTMPGLYRVVNGIDVFDPKFNIVSPGADPDVYFPFTDDERRMKGLHPGIEELVLGDGNGGPSRGAFENPDKPLLFTMARLDRIKNIPGLVDWYGRCPELRERTNLLVVGGHLDLSASKDREEQEQIRRMHELIDQHGLEGRLRWVGFQTERNFVGELYRFVADRRGAFVQPALFEAYGLTVVEAMSSGLPTFATCYGGPSEIIVDGESGFHIDPNYGETAANKIAGFYEQVEQDSAHWERISRGAIERIESRYTWKLYGERMMTLARVYGFWKYVTNLEHAETRRYLEMFYGLQYRRLVEGVPTGSREG